MTKDLRMSTRCHHEIHRVSYLKVVPKLILNCCMSSSCIEFSMEEVNLKPRVPTKAICAEHLELRREILTCFNLQKQEREKSGSVSSGFSGVPVFQGDSLYKTSNNSSNNVSLKA